MTKEEEAHKPGKSIWRALQLETKMDYFPENLKRKNIQLFSSYRQPFSLHTHN